ncbi:unnamed protein product [Dibothriocephalus latus]|uniref:SEC7 domain-containing protein n=1 Tax=Dibothriocephalus latus TaxID=60516 RepID=A0A3P6TL61_DIBLA|nr:unnamed protein product [Dibothriocephalus latus]
MSVTKAFAAMFLTRALEKILNEKETKRANNIELRNACKEGIKCLAARSNPPGSSSSADHKNSSGNHFPPLMLKEGPLLNDERILLPFELACGSKSPKVVAIALDSIQKLIAYGHVSNDAYDSSGKTRLIERIVATVCSCFQVIHFIKFMLDHKRRIHSMGVQTDDEVQLQVIKALLTVVTSPIVEVHEKDILLVVRTCYSIYMATRNAVNQTTARATLTQMLNVIFQKMEQASLDAAVLHEQTHTSGENQHSKPTQEKSVSLENSDQGSEAPPATTACTVEKAESSVAPVTHLNGDEVCNVAEPPEPSHSSGQDQDPKPTLEKSASLENAVQGSEVSPVDTACKVENAESSVAPVSHLNGDEECNTDECDESQHTDESANNATESEEQTTEPTQNGSPEESEEVMVKSSDSTSGCDNAEHPTQIKDEDQVSEVDGAQSEPDSDAGSKSPVETSEQSPTPPCVPVDGTVDSPAEPDADAGSKSPVETSERLLTPPCVPVDGTVGSPPADTVQPPGSPVSEPSVNEDANNSASFDTPADSTPTSPIDMDTISAGDTADSSTPGDYCFANVVQKDAFLVFRSLCRLSIKPLSGVNPSDPKSHELRSKILSLQLLLSILQNPGPAFRSSEVFVTAIKQYLCVALSKNGVSTVPEVFELSLAIFLSLLTHFKQHLKMQIEVFFKEILLSILESPSTTFEHKWIVVAALQRICNDAQCVWSHDLYNVSSEAQSFLGSEPMFPSSHNIHVQDADSTSSVGLNRSTSDDPEAFESRKAQKEIYEKGISLFNHGKLQKGLSLLRENNLLGETAEDVALFLHNEARLSRTAIGDYLGENEAFALEVMYAYVDCFEFAGAEFVSALRLVPLFYYVLFQT